MTVSKLGDSLVNIIGSDIVGYKRWWWFGVIKISDNKPKGTEYWKKYNSWSNKTYKWKN